jgi:hypothetical protein
MDSEDISFEDEPTQTRDRRRQVVELDSSIDIDNSYPPPERRTAAPRSGVGNSGYRPGAATAAQRRAVTDTPSPEESEIDISGSMDDAPRRAMPAIGPSAAYQAAIRAGVGSSSSSSAAGARKPSAISSSSSRHRHEDSIDSLNPDLDEEYVVPEYRPTASASSRNPPPRRQQQQHEEEEVSIDFEDSTDAMDVRVSNNTLIKKAQALQQAGASKDRRRQEEEQRERDAEDQELARLAALRQADIARQERLTAEALAARKLEQEKKAAYEARRQREREEEEEEREREREMEEARKLREQAEIEEEDYDADEFSAAPAAETSSKKHSASDASLAALDSVLLSDEDAEIEAARRQLEEEEEAELQREREAAATAGGQQTLLDTRAFSNKASADISFGDSADLSSARRRQASAEEDYDDAAERAAEERREKEYQERVRQVEEKENEERRQAHARTSSIERAVEESYEEEDFDDPAQLSRGSKKASRGATPTPQLASSQQPRHAAPATAAAPAAAPFIATVGDVSAPPSIFAAALASLSPEVSALVMKAVADQMVAQQHHAQQAQYQHARTHHVPSAGSTSSIFRPQDSAPAASDAWEKLLRMRSAHPKARYEPVDSDSAGNGAGGLGMQQPPVAVPAGAPTSWEGMMAAVSASQLARKTHTEEADRLFSKRPQSFSGSSNATYPPPPHIPFPAARAVNHDPSSFNADGAMHRYINGVLGSGLTEAQHRTNLRVENEKDALRRLLTFNPHTAGRESSVHPEIPGASRELSHRVGEQKQLYLQDQAILNSVLRRVLTKSEGQVRVADLSGMNQLDFQHSEEKKDAPKMVAEGVLDDGRPLPAADVIRLIEEGYPFAAYDAWQHFSTNTLARSVMLAAEPPSQTYTRHVVEQTMKQTLSELLADEKIVQSIKRATMKRLKSRLQYSGQTAQQSTYEAAFRSRPQPASAPAAAAPVASRR